MAARARGKSFLAKFGLFVELRNSEPEPSNQIKMNIIEQPYREGSKTDLAPDDFPRIDGKCTTLIEDAHTIPVSELMCRGALFNKVRRPVRAARSYYQAMLQTKNMEQKAILAGVIGGLAEEVGKFDIAVSFYRAAIALQPSDTQAQYFSQNNLGYSLNQLGCYEEGEVHCREAININARRANGHKNLGLSLWGQRRFLEAAECFVAATQADALDPRSTRHLQDLLAERPEIAEEYSVALASCQKAVRDARLKPMTITVER